MRSARRAKPHQALRVIAGFGAIAYLFGTAVYLVFHGSWPTPDFLIPPLLLFAVIAGRGWSFLFDWFPFLLLLIVYQSFAGIADDLNARVHFWGLILADKWLFGGEVPTIRLQERYFRSDTVMWYDWAGAFLHAAHFVAPATFGFLLWLRSRRWYWRYMLALMAMFFAGFITYYLFPAAPPWMAAEQGLIPPVTRVLIHTLMRFPTSAPLALLYQYFSPNDVAAMPSLHGAVPAFLALVALGMWGWRGLPLIIYPLATGIAFVYLGEHYVIDILAGWIYALGAFLTVWLAMPYLLTRLGQALRAQRLMPGRLSLPALPSWPLAALALVLIVLVWINPVLYVPLYPDQESLSPEAEVRAGAVEARSLDDLDPQDCASGTSSSSALDRALEPFAGQYAAYLIGLDSPVCFSITAQAAIPAPDEEELRHIELDQTSRMPTRVWLPSEPPGYLTVVQVGTPVEGLESREGLWPGQRYALVIRADNALYQAELQRVAAEVARLVFGPDLVRQ